MPAVNDKVSIQSGLKPAPRTAGNKGKNAGEDIFMPQDTPLILFTKTTDGSKRGYVSMNAVDDKGNPVRSSSQIFLYYTDFRIDRSIGGQSTCDVRFFVNTNLNSRLINLDVKLVWPGMTTNLSFVDVPPNSPTYFDYALVGDGCYTMDKMPNIVNVKYTSKMEADLDKIDSGEKNYKDMIRLYYDDFEKPLEKAKEEMQGVKIKLKEEETDEICEKCGRNMVVKVGRFGKFLACPGYPECKNTKPLIFRTKAKCPECGGDVIEKKTKRGSSFYGCSNYPKCNFMTWDAPSDEVCPRCGKSLFKRKGNVLYCPDTEGCGFTKPAPRKKKTEE